MEHKGCRLTKDPSQLLAPSRENLMRRRGQASNVEAVVNVEARCRESEARIPKQHYPKRQSLAFCVERGSVLAYKDIPVID